MFECENRLLRYVYHLPEGIAENFTNGIRQQHLGRLI